MKPAPGKWKDDASINKILTNFNYGSGAGQIDQVNIRPLHLAGYTGTGISIAVIDAGFPTVNTGAAFSRLWTNNHIKASYDFVTKTGDIYNASLSVLMAPSC